jgi:SAM-dependent methyltransferase
MLFIILSLYKTITKISLIERCFPRNFVKKLYAYNLFISRKLTNDENGYWKITPMPKKSELDLYYKKFYYNYKKNMKIVTSRDLFHFQIMCNQYPKIENGGLVFLNFGSGFSGISQLFYNRGNKVINVDPSQMWQIEDLQAVNLSDISELKESVDIFYASHSLEHVPDVDLVIHEVNRFLKQDGILFIEVPNAEFNGNGGGDGLICEPHTYYFKNKYFENLNFKGILNPRISGQSLEQLPKQYINNQVIWYIGQKVV